MIRKEVIRLTIGNIIFHMNSEQYVRLSAYLEKAQAYYHSLPNGQKLLSDFEINISEFLLEKLEEADQVLTCEIIDATIENFGELPKPVNSSKQTDNDENPNISQRLYNNRISHQQNLGKLVFTVLSVLGLSV